MLHSHLTCYQECFIHLTNLVPKIVYIYKKTRFCKINKLNKKESSGDPPEPGSTKLPRPSIVREGGFIKTVLSQRLLVGGVWDKDLHHPFTLRNAKE